MTKTKNRIGITSDLNRRSQLNGLLNVLSKYCYLSSIHKNSNPKFFKRSILQAIRLLTVKITWSSFRFLAIKTHQSLNSKL